MVHQSHQYQPMTPVDTAAYNVAQSNGEARPVISFVEILSAEFIRSAGENTSWKPIKWSPV